ncbi:MAG: phosphoribosylamine--glycine ligase, partial [Bacteroidales bacterium]|nr:phosphoribosylamine--glycine ligase [Bacteroidales bacterium]
MNVLLIGSGGRESALAWKIAQSPKLTKLYATPGNPGIADIATNLNIKVSDFDGIAKAVKDNDIKLVVVGPEVPLIDGLADYLRSIENPPLVCGPTKDGAQLEGSKDFAKQFMVRHNIPTARYKTFNGDTYNQAVDFLKNLQPPYVLKADGPAAGKGVIIESDFQVACNELKEMFSGKFGKSS